MHVILCEAGALRREAHGGWGTAVPALWERARPRGGSYGML